MWAALALERSAFKSVGARRSSTRRRGWSAAGTVETGGWWTHGLPPAVGTSDRADTPLSAIAAIDGAGWRDDGRDTLSVPRPRPAGHRGSRGAGAPVENAVGRAAAGFGRRTR